MLGVNVTPEHIKQAEDFIPKFPGLVKQAAASVDSFDVRLKSLEAIAAEILQEVRLGRHNDSDTRAAGTGATQRAIERGQPITGNGS